LLGEFEILIYFNVDYSSTLEKQARLCLRPNCLLEQQASSFSIQQGTMSLSTQLNYVVNQSMNKTQLSGWLRAHTESDGLAYGSDNQQFFHGYKIQI
jgi:hypothetical protein